MDLSKYEEDFVERTGSIKAIEITEENIIHLAESLKWLVGYGRASVTGRDEDDLVRIVPCQLYNMSHPSNQAVDQVLMLGGGGGSGQLGWAPDPTVTTSGRGLPMGKLGDFIVTSGDKLGRPRIVGRDEWLDKMERSS